MTTADVTRTLSLRFGRIDRVWIITALIFATVALLVPEQVGKSASFTFDSLLTVGPFIILSVVVAAFARASGLDHQIGRAFSGNPAQAILLAAAFGSLSPFCSCGVVPIIAGLLVAGVPLAPVMAFWLASPLMNPEMFILMTPVLGIEFSLAKLAAAFGIGTLSGVGTHLLVKGGVFENALRPTLARSCGCSSSSALKTEKIVWGFWKDQKRLQAFSTEARRSGCFC